MENWKKISKKSMPTKTFLPGCRITYHPIYDNGDTTTHSWVQTNSMDELFKSQEQFIKALQIVFENDIREVWTNENLELVNNIRISIGLNKIEEENK